MFAESMTVGDAIAWGATTLDESDEMGKHTREDALLLLRHVLGISQAEIFASRERPLTALQTEAFNALIRQRSRGVPIQYLTGVQEFFGLPFHVTPAVLIPRPETEHLVEAAIERLQSRPAPVIADIGTGSGAIAVALAQALPNAHIVAIDVSPIALEVARQNATRNGVAERIRFVESDLFAASAILTDHPTGHRFDAIVSNPPYIAERERKSLPKEVRDYEPALALFAGPTGLEFYQRLIPATHAHLATDGWLLMEIGHGQRDAVNQMLQEWNVVEFVPDLQGIPRVAIARKS
ncbi:MAG: peptide chain release factor N(5)-glutamine methyltransferase [Acidobacteriaceae bacterium]